MSQSLSTMGRRRSRSLPPQSATTSHLGSSSSLRIDRSLDIAGPLRLSPHAGPGHSASPSLWAQRADAEDDLVDQLLDVPHPDEEPVIQVASSRSITPSTDEQVQPPGNRLTDSRLNDVTTVPAEPRETTERPTQDTSSEASLSHAVQDERENVDSDTRLSELREIGQLARQPIRGSSSPAQFQAESLRQEVEAQWQNGQLPNDSRELPPPISDSATLILTATPPSSIGSIPCQTSTGSDVGALAVPATDGPGSRPVAGLAIHSAPHVSQGLFRSPVSSTRQLDSPSPAEGSRKRRTPPSPSSPQGQRRKRPKLQKAQAIINVKQVDGPAFWTIVPPLRPNIPLWVAVVTTEVYGEIDASSRPLALISTRPLDLLPSFRDSVVLDVSHKLSNKQSRSGQSSRAARVRTRITNAGPFQALDVEQLLLAMRWTREMLALHVERDFPSRLGPQKYLMLPLASQTLQRRIEDDIGKVVIDWTEMRMLDRGVSRLMTEEYRWPHSAHSLRDKVLFDPFHPRRWLLVENQAYVPQTPTHDPEVASSNTTGQAWASGVWSVVVDGSEMFHPEGDVFAHKQLTAEQLNRFGSHLHVSFLSTTVFRSTSLIPAISSALDDTLLGLEASNRLFDGILCPQATLSAITLPGAAQWDIRDCYERQELLGDTVLRLLCAIGLRSTRTAETGHVARNAKTEMRKLESNANLRQVAVEAGLLPYLRCKPPWEAVWGPSGGTIFERKRSRGQEDIALEAKTCADVVEALIGAAFLQGQGSLRLALKVLEKMNFRLPQVQEITVVAERAGRLDPNWGDGYPEDVHGVGRDVSITPASGSATLPTPLCYSLGRLHEVAAILGCNMSEYRETEKLLNRGTTDRWRAHWGGTALGYQAIYTFNLCYLLRRLPSAPPRILSPLAQGLMSRECLAAFCVTSGLADTIIVVSPEEQRDILNYKAAVLAATSGAGADPSDTDEFWTEIEAPAVLAHYIAVLFEGMICDADFSFEPALKGYRTRLQPFLEKYCRAITDGTVVKGKRLGDFLYQNGCHGLTMTVDRNEDLAAEQRSVAIARVHDYVWGEARAPNNAIAKHVATRIALDKLSKLPSSAYCTCSTPTTDRGTPTDDGDQFLEDSGPGERDSD